MLINAFGSNEATSQLSEVIIQAQHLISIGETEVACKIYRQWLSHSRENSTSPNVQAIAWFNLGVLHSTLGQLNEAVFAYQNALKLNPAFGAPRVNLGLILEREAKTADAMKLWREGLFDSVEQVNLLKHLGRVSERNKHHSEAERFLRECLTLDPYQADVVQHWGYLRAQQCKWPVLQAIMSIDGTQIRPPEELMLSMGPFATIALTDDPGVQLSNTASWLFARGLLTRSPPASRNRLVIPEDFHHSHYCRRKLRIGYASADLHHHATAMLMVHVLELTNRARFELVAFSWGPDDRSDLRARIKASFDNWYEARGLDDISLAEMIRSAGIDILVDLKGLTQDSRPTLFAQRLAPIQVSFLGYPGSIPLNHIDYCLTDSVISPPELRQYYAEAVCCLPDSYQPNDREKAISSFVPAREELGLPDNAFVFCCFNNSYKITPEVFSIWMALLRECENSVLWLIRSNDEAERQLRKQAQDHGISSERLIFAPLVHINDHLARLTQADLCLDTFPCGAHTTASDALWAGLPILTRTGRSFASRVAASLLKAVGLPELITSSPEAYRTTALTLAQHPTLLRGIRQRLIDNRLTCPLFDTTRYARHLEDAYTLMWLQYESGDSPCDIEVPVRTQ